MAKKTTVTTDGTTPNPSGTMSRPMTAKDGSVRPIAEIALAAELSRGLR